MIFVDIIKQRNWLHHERHMQQDVTSKYQTHEFKGQRKSNDLLIHENWNHYSPVAAIEDLGSAKLWLQ